MKKIIPLLLLSILIFSCQNNTKQEQQRNIRKFVKKEQNIENAFLKRKLAVTKNNYLKVLDLYIKYMERPATMYYDKKIYNFIKANNVSSSYIKRFKQYRTLLYEKLQRLSKKHNTPEWDKVLNFIKSTNNNL